ncbi:MAG: DUF5076 domain-containing protein [Opitutales bacterium]|nr:DUF5076 domain-containing protein [Opitutales bacterium]
MKKKSSRRNARADLVIRVNVSAAGAAEIEVNSEKWKDPDVWGTLLSDIAGTIAECYSTEAERARFTAAMEKAFTRERRAADNVGEAPPSA